MALIRQASAVLAARDAVVLDLGDLKRQAEELKRRAREEAERILAEARAERVRLIESAAKEGHAQGFAKGLEEGRAKGEEAGRAAALAETKERLAALEKSWGAALDLFEGQRGQMLLEARRDVLRLGVRIGELVTKRMVERAPSETAAAQAADVLTKLSRPTRAVLAVHPDDAAAVREALPGIAARLVNAAHVELATDEALARGSCVLRTGSGGEIDASIELQLARIVEELLPGDAESGATP